MEEISIYTDKIPSAVWLGSFFFVCLSFVVLAIIGRRYVVKGMMWALLVSYYAVVLCSTVFCRAETTPKYELTPFWSYTAVANGDPSITHWEIILNVVLFIPIGLLLGGAFGKKLNAWVRLVSILVVGCVLSVLIEYQQYYLCKGFAETDDVIHNTLGCLVGYLLWCGLVGLKNVFNKNEETRNGIQ